MNSTTFYIVRHGESEWNVKRLVQGQRKDMNGLTEKGRMQAEEIAAGLKHVKAQHIISSDLKRAVETAEIIARTFKIPVMYSEQLREQSHGEYEGTSAEAYLSRFTKWNTLTDEEKHHYKVAREGESNYEARERFKSSLLELAQQYPGDTIIIVTHNGVMRYTYMELAQKSYEGWGFKNTGYMIITSNGEKLELVQAVNLKEI